MHAPHRKALVRLAQHPLLAKLSVLVNNVLLYRLTYLHSGNPAVLTVDSNLGGSTRAVVQAQQSDRVAVCFI